MPVTISFTDIDKIDANALMSVYDLLIENGGDWEVSVGTLRFILDHAIDYENTPPEIEDAFNAARNILAVAENNLSGRIARNLSVIAKVE